MLLNREGNDPSGTNARKKQESGFPVFGLA